MFSVDGSYDYAQIHEYYYIRYLFAVYAKNLFTENPLHSNLVPFRLQFGLVLAEEMLTSKRSEWVRTKKLSRKLHQQQFPNLCV